MLVDWWNRIHGVDVRQLAFRSPAQFLFDSQVVILVNIIADDDVFDTLYLDKMCVDCR